MDNRVARYVERQLYTGKRLMTRITRGRENNIYPTRTITVLVRKYIADFLVDSKVADRWVVVPGLRGVGKTTVVAQTYLWISDDIGARVNLLYISLDEVVERLNSNLSEVIDAYQQILGTTLEDVEKPTFIFIDEVQADPGWARALKFLYERTDNVFLLCTGSSATNLQMDADIAGRRAKIDKLYPLSFPEYQVLTQNVFPKKGLKKKLIEHIYYARSAREVYEGLKSVESVVNQQWTQYDRNSIPTYLKTGTMPFTLKNDIQSVYASLRAMMDKIIVTDLQSLRHFTTDSIMAMKRLVFILADSGDVIALDKLSRIVGTSKPQLLNMLEAMIKAELLIKVPAHGSNNTATRYPSRYNFMSAAIRASCHDVVGNQGTESSRNGTLLEDVATLHYYREFVTKHKGSLTHYYEKGGRGHCDFILRVANTHQIAIEFGLGKKSAGQAEKTMSATKCLYGIVFSDAGLYLHKDKNIVMVPLDYFFLM